MNTLSFPCVVRLQDLAMRTEGKGDSIVNARDEGAMILDGLLTGEAVEWGRRLCGGYFAVVPLRVSAR